MYAQTVETGIVCSLPAELNESSSLEIDHDGNFWSANDSGNEPVLYHFDSTGNILHKVFVTNSANTDWEDMALTDAGTLYIGNFGNNLNDRQDLAILSVSINDLLPGDNFREAAFIYFSYAEQSEFPPENEQLNFDCEALVFQDDSLFFFTKNRTVPFSGYTYMYGVPALPGNYSVHRLDSCWIGVEEYSGRLTSADVSPDGRLILLSMTQVVIFQDTITGRWLRADHVFRNLSGLSQKEAVCWADSCTLFITDEFFDPQLPGGKLYSASLCDDLTLSGATVLSHPQNVFPQPANNLLTVNFACESANDLVLAIFWSIDGKRLAEFKWSGSGHYDVDTSDWSDGIYVMTTQTLRSSYSQRILIIRR